MPESPLGSEVQPVAPQPAPVIGVQVDLILPADASEKQYRDVQPNQAQWVVGGRYGGGTMRGTWERDGKAIVGFWEILGAAILFWMFNTLTWSWKGLVVGALTFLWGWVWTRLIYGKRWTVP